MGISGLLPLLKEAQKHGHISEFKGKRLAVDAYVWLHKGAFGCAEDLVKGGKTTRFVDYAMHRVRLLRHHGITPFIVFDGGPLPAKKGTEVSRAKSRAEHLARAKSAESQGRLKEARDCYTKCVDITPEMAYQLIKALRAEDVEYIVAPYEADAQLCMLEREGIVDGIITEDSDLLVFGCKQVIFKLDGDGNCVNIHRDRLANISGAPMHGWTNTEFRRMAMLSGCDYLPSLPGVGIKTAHRLLRRFKSVEKHLRLEGTRVPDDYVASFNQAELAFLHQRVYDPSLLTLRPLAPFPAGGLQEDDEKWIGLELSSEIAQGLATGGIHPETYQPIEDQWPDYQPAQRNVNASVSAPSRAPSGPLTTLAKLNTPLTSTKSRGPMDAFVTRSASKSEPKRSTLALPRPVGVNGSGPSRLSDLVSPSAASRSAHVGVIARRTGSGGIEAAAAARRQEVSGADKGISRGVKAGQAGTVKSKFFGGGTQPARPVREAPSPDKGKEDLGLIWEASSEAGPDVDFDESQLRTRGTEQDDSQPALVEPNRRGPSEQLRQSTQHGCSSPSLVMSPSGSPTTPTALESRRSLMRYRHDDEAESLPHALTSPGAPLLSSPPNMTLSPLRAPLPQHDESGIIADVMYEETGHRYSSPPDIGRQRSLTADPFSPSPSPRASKRSSPAREANSIAVTATADCFHPASDIANVSTSQPVLSSSPSYGPPSRVLDSQPLSAPRTARCHLAEVQGGWTTGSSDVLDDEEIVTPSYNVGYVANENEMADRKMRDDDEIHATSDEEDDAGARVLQAEVERRKERAQVVSAGWKQRFSLQGPPSAQRQPSRTPVSSSSRPAKRRRTEPAALVPSSPIPTPTRTSRADTRSPLLAHPLNIDSLSPLTTTPYGKVRVDEYDIGRLATPTADADSKTPSHHAQTGMSAVKAISAFAPKTPIPLSACAPRFLSTTRLGSAQLPPSPAQVKRDRENERQQLQQRRGGGVKQELAAITPVRAVEGGDKREGRSVVSRFKFSGTVPDLRGRSWI